MEEATGYDPVDAKTPPVFKTGAISISATLPNGTADGTRTRTN